LTNHEEDMQAVQNQRILLYEQFNLGEVSETDFLSKKTELSDKIAYLKGQISREPLIKTVRSFDGITELTPVIVKTLIKEIIVHDDNRIKVIWNHQDKIAAIYG